MVACGIAPDYFLDNMSFDEVEAILKENERREKDEWEKIRYQCFYSVVAIAGGKTYRKPSDLFQFPWEKPHRETKILTEEEKQSKKRLADRIARKLNK